MSSTYFKNIKLTIFGESHQKYIGLVMDNLKAGIKLDLEFINQEILRRKAGRNLSSPRKETDEFEIVSGFFNGYTTGAPLVFLIKNNDVDSSSYQKELPRPGHVDYAAYIKNNGFNDYRGSGHSSGRLTLPLTIAGAIAKQILKNKNVIIGSHLQKMQELEDDNFDYNNIEKQILDLEKQTLPMLNKQKKKEVLEKIEICKKNKDSIGGIIECVAINVLPGIGEPFFDSLESTISSLAFSIPAIKGIEFGLGFNFNNYYGSQVVDELRYENNQVIIKNNYNGGINGGISNGNPIVFRCVVKPTASINKEVNSINLSTKENVNLKTKGRHDSAIVLRCSVIIEAICALAILDLYTQKFGNDWYA